MRVSAYARATNPKYANFFDWSGLAGQLGTKAGKALSTTGGAAKLGAGIGAGVGAINYLVSDDKSIGNLAGQIAGSAALGGAAGYGGSSLRNAWQARKASQQTIDTSAITVPNTSGKTQSGNSQSYPLANANPIGATTERISPKSQKIKPDELKPNEPEGSVRRRGRQRTIDASRKTSPFANFKVRRYNGFVY